ncbi:hypothetical protein Salat_0258300 [Sesamum alatum]|uniref:Uncharacterized protein n=1 Tax=Sesamum alatum TaxID=300844 RepID=A0AAE2CZ05_9LAMI|nr:hypothetical protein Salat_0258300 [Sesamum alatum]
MRLVEVDEFEDSGMSSKFRLSPGVELLKIYFSLSSIGSEFVGTSKGRVSHGLEMERELLLVIEEGGGGFGGWLVGLCGGGGEVGGELIYVAEGDEGGSEKGQVDEGSGSFVGGIVGEEDGSGGFSGGSRGGEKDVVGREGK